MGLGDKEKSEALMAHEVFIETSHPLSHWHFEEAAAYLYIL